MYVMNTRNKDTDVTAAATVIYMYISIYIFRLPRMKQEQSDK